VSSFSSKAWLCKKHRFIQRDGAEGILSFENDVFKFKAINTSQILELALKDIKVVNINNIVGKSEMLIDTIDKKTYVFVFTEPVSYASTFEKILLWPEVYRNYKNGTLLAGVIVLTKKWKSFLIKTIPADKILHRTELNLVRVTIASVIASIVTLAAFAIIVLLFSA